MDGQQRNLWLPSLLIPRRHFVGSARTVVTRRKGGALTPLSVLGSAIAWNDATPSTDAINANVTVPANTTALVLLMGCYNSTTPGAHFDAVEFDDVAAPDVIAMSASNAPASPALQVAVLIGPSIGVHALTATRSLSLNRAFGIAVFVGGDLHGTPVSDTDAPATTTSNVNPRSISLDVATDGSLAIAAAVSQGHHRDPFTGSGILDTAPLQEGDTGGGSTTADLAFAVFSGEVDAGNGQTGTSTAAGADGGQVVGIVLRPAA